MNCEEAREQGQRDHCPECGAWFRDVDEIRDAVGKLECLPLPDEFAAGVRRRASRPPILVYALLAAAGILIGVAVTLFSMPPKPELDRERLAEHLQASRILFREADQARAEHVKQELKATDLERRTRELRTQADDPVLEAYLDEVARLLNGFRQSESLDRERIRIVLNRIPEIERKTGVTARPIEITLPDDTYLQARADMYAGRYPEAAAKFVEAGNDYWASEAYLQSREFGRAIDRILRASYGGWAKRSTAEQIKRIAVGAGAIVAARNARAATIEDILEMLSKGNLASVTIDSVHVLGNFKGPFIGEFYRLMRLKRKGQLDQEEYDAFLAKVHRTAEGVK